MIEAVVAITDAPARDELVDRLRIPPRLPAFVAGARRAEPRRRLRTIVIRDGSGFLATEILALQLELRPLEHGVGDPEPAAAAERLDHRITDGVEVLECPVARLGTQERQACPPSALRADVAAEMPKQRPRVGAVAATLGEREAAAAAQLRAKFEEQVCGR